MPRSGRRGEDGGRPGVPSGCGVLADPHPGAFRPPSVLPPPPHHPPAAPLRARPRPAPLATPGARSGQTARF